MGPDLMHAREKGNKVAKEMLNNLFKQHGLDDTWVMLPKAGQRWKKAKADFIKSVEDMFVEDAANSF